MSQTRQAHELLELMPFAARLGINIQTAGPAELRGRLGWSPELCTAGGVFHGGAVMALTDSVGAACAYLNLGDGKRTATTSSSTVFLRAVRHGELVATACPLRTGATAIVVQTEVTDGEGRLVAHTTQTQAVLCER